MKSHVCKGQVLIDIRDVRKQIKELKQPLVTCEAIPESVRNEINEAIENTNRGIDKCSESAENMKSIVKLPDGQVVEAEDSVVDMILAGE